MNDRMITLLGALFALLVLVGLLFQPSGQPSIGKPNTEQLGPHGYYALFQWLELSRVPVASLRERLTELDRFADTGNILMLTLPVDTALRGREVERLQAWIAQGNTLLLVAALNDTPHWTAQVDGARLLEDLEDLTKLRFQTLQEEQPEDGLTLDDIEQLFSKQEIVLNPSASTNGNGGVHPLLRTVDALQSQSDGPSSKWKIELSTEGDQVESRLEPEEEAALEPPQLVLELATQSSTGAAALWEMQQGRGRIVLSAASGLFSNRSLGRGGNAQLMNNLVAWHLGSQGHFIIDDLHQGLSVLYDPAAFYKDPRVGYSIVFLLAFWLLYLVGTNNRLAPVVPADNSPQQHQFIAAVGGFMSRKLAVADTALLMFDRWFAQLDRVLNGATPMSAGAPASSFAGASNELWQRLLLLPTVDPMLVSSLQRLQAKAQKGQTVNLKDLHNQLQQMRSLIG